LGKLPEIASQRRPGMSSRKISSRLPAVSVVNLQSGRGEGTSILWSGS
jgi:hypothetical protein